MTLSIEIDARGHKCPVPTLKLRRALADAAMSGQIRLLADDPMAQIDVPHFCTQNEVTLLGVTQIETYWAFQIAFEAAPS